MKRFLSVLILIALLCSSLLACGDDKEKGDTGADVNTDFAKGSEEMFTDRDKEQTGAVGGEITITLKDGGSSASDASVLISGDTITLTKDATYVISGELTCGSLIVDMPEAAKPQLILSEVSVTCADSAALYIKECDKVFVTLEENTENTFSVSGDFAETDEGVDGAIYSKQDITFNGAGSLSVSCAAAHAVVAKDDFVVTGGVYTITSASHGVDANDSIRLTGAVMTVSSGKDALHAENKDDATLGFVYIESGEYILSSAGDGISAGYYVQIEGGSFNIVTGGGSENGESHTSDGWGNMGGFGGGRPGIRSSSSDTTEDSTSIKGIKAADTVLINSGKLVLDTADDAVHSNASVAVRGGEHEIETGDDALHADGTLAISGGTVVINESYEGLEGLDISVSGGKIKITADDDGINAAGGNDSSGFGGVRGDSFGGSSNGSITVSGGEVYMNASGDGIDANGSFKMTGGLVTVCGPTSGDTSVLDYDREAIISGGTFIGTGANMMAQTFSSSEQGVIAVTVGNQSAGTLITLVDSSGEEILSYEPALSFQIVIISTPDMKSGKEYTITVGGASGTFEAA